MNLIEPDAYAQDIDRAVRLRGQTGDIMRELEGRMQQLSVELKFEQAAAVRDQIGALAKVLHQQAVDTTGSDADADVLAVVTDGAHACVNLAMIRAADILATSRIFPRALAKAPNLRKFSRRSCRNTI